MDPKRAARIREGKEFDRQTGESWKRVHEGSSIDANLTEKHPRRRQQKEPKDERTPRQRPDLRFSVRPVDDDPAHETVFEVKDRAWDAMRPENVKRAARRDRAQVLRYVENIISLGPLDDGDDVSAALIYRRGPSDAALRTWIEDYLGQEAIAVLWQDADPLEAEWFAATVRVALAALSPLADESHRALIISMGRDEGPTVEMVVAPQQTAAFGVVMGPVSAPHRCPLGIVWLAALDANARDAYFARAGLDNPANASERRAVRKAIESLAHVGWVFDVAGDRGDLRGAAAPSGSFGPRDEQLVVTASALRSSTNVGTVLVDVKQAEVAALAMQAAHQLADALTVATKQA